MRVLITGGCGFIGSHLVEFHLARGDEVHTVDDLSTGTLENIKPFSDQPTFHFEKADILTWPDLEKWVRWSDRIYHMAAIVGMYRVLSEPINVIRTNVLACERLLNVVVSTSSRAKIIIASTSSVYGHSSKSALSESDDLIINASGYPLTTYGISKITDEALTMAYRHTYNLPITAIRLFNVIGPRQSGRYGMVVPRFVQQSCQNASITVFGDGNQTRSFCDVRDVVSVLDKIAEQNIDIINVGNDHEITINDLAHLVRNLANSTSKIEYIPLNEAYGMEFSEIKHRRPDLTKFFEVTHYQHQWSLEQTIMDLILRFRAG